MLTCMSEPVTRADILQLCACLDRFSLAVRESGLNTLNVGDCLEDWELVEADYQGPGFGQVSHHWLEEGPPPTPPQLPPLLLLSCLSLPASLLL